MSYTNLASTTIHILKEIDKIILTHLFTMMYNLDIKFSFQETFMGNSLLE